MIFYKISKFLLRVNLINLKRSKVWYIYIVIKFNKSISYFFIKFLIWSSNFCLIYVQTLQKDKEIKSLSLPILRDPDNPRG